MLLLLILPLLISGYYVQQWNYKHYYQLHRYTGQLLYLKSAALGAICLSVSFLILILIFSIKPIVIFDFKIGFDLLGFLSNILQNKLDIQRKSLPFFILLTFFSFVVAIFWSYGENIINIIKRITDFDEEEFYKKENKRPSLVDKWLIAKFGYIVDIKHELFSENPLDHLLLTSYQKHEDIMLHMSDRKVYIGFVTVLSEPNEADSLAQEISIFPLKSGYRDKDNLTVTMTTNYKPEDALYIILRREEIISATIYNADIFKNFQRNSTIRLAENRFIQMIDNNEKITKK